MSSQLRLVSASSSVSDISPGCLFLVLCQNYCFPSFPRLGQNGAHQPFLQRGFTETEVRSEESYTGLLGGKGGTRGRECFLSSVLSHLGCC